MEIDERNTLFNDIFTYGDYSAYTKLSNMLRKKQSYMIVSIENTIEILKNITYSNIRVIRLLFSINDRTDKQIFPFQHIDYKNPIFNELVKSFLSHSCSMNVSCTIEELQKRHVDIIFDVEYEPILTKSLLKGNDEIVEFILVNHQHTFMDHFTFKKIDDDDDDEFIPIDLNHFRENIYNSIVFKTTRNLFRHKFVEFMITEDILKKMSGVSYTQIKNERETFYDEHLFINKWNDSDHKDVKTLNGIYYHFD